MILSGFPLPVGTGEFAKGSCAVFTLFLLIKVEENYASCGWKWLDPATSTREKTSVPSHEIHVGSLLQLDFPASSTAKSANSWHGTSCLLPSRVSNFVHHLWALTFLPYFELTLDTKNTPSHSSHLKKKTNLKEKKTWMKQKNDPNNSWSLLCSGEVGLGHRHCFHGIGLCCLLALQLAS